MLAPMTLRTLNRTVLFYRAGLSRSLQRTHRAHRNTYLKPTCPCWAFVMACKPWLSNLAVKCRVHLSASLVTHKLSALRHAHCFITLKTAFMKAATQLLTCG